MTDAASPSPVTSSQGADGPVLVDVTDGVATVTLNRPEAMNSLDVATKVALRDAVVALGEDPDVRCVVLTGTGRAFCVGQDLREHVDGLTSGSPEEVWRTVPEHYNPIALALHALDKPVVAAVNGPAVGIGASLAFACDLVLAAEGARFIEVFVRRGITPDGGGAYLLPRLVGLHKAKELVFFGDDCPAEEAERIGLVNRVAPAEELDAATGKLVDELLACAPIAVGLAKRVIDAAAKPGLSQTLEQEVTAQQVCVATEDFAEGARAFAEKRQPEFSNR